MSWDHMSWIERTRLRRVPYRVRNILHEHDGALAIRGYRQ